MRRKIITMALCVVLALGSVLSANAAVLNPTGGIANKKWNTNIYLNLTANAFYRLTGNASQPDLYKFDNVRMQVVHFCNSSTNVVKTVTDTNTYKITTYADAAIGTSAQNGSSRLTVKDDTYGQGTKLIYYK